MTDTFEDALQQRLSKKLETSGNIALELKNATQALIDSIKKHKETYDRVGSIEEPNFEEMMEEAESWGELFSNLMFYDEIKREMSKKTEVEKMMFVIKLKAGIKDD